MLVVSLFEKHDVGTKSRPESFSAEGAWQRFGRYLVDAGDLPEWAAAGVLRAGHAAAGLVSPPAGLGEGLRQRIAACCQPTFARISPREVLTEPAEGIRFTGHGLGEPWGRAIHCLLEHAARDPGLDLEAAAATALSAEDVSPVYLDKTVATVRDVMASDVWRRSQASDRRYVEAPFSLQVRGEDLPENVRKLAGAGGPPLPTVVRGVIDLVFQEPDGQEPDSQEPDGRRWTVVDWKTDSVTTASEPLLEAHYRPQVELYAECWSHLCGPRSGQVTARNETQLTMLFGDDR